MGDNTGDLLQSTARSLRRRFSAGLSEWDLAPGQARALRLIRDLEAPRLSVLAEHLRIAPRSATEVVDALESRGLVLRCADPHDRRATCVSVTDTGSETCGLIDDVRTRAAREFLSVLPAADRKELDRLLRLLLEAND